MYQLNIFQPMQREREEEVCLIRHKIDVLGLLLLSIISHNIITHIPTNINRR